MLNLDKKQIVMLLMGLNSLKFEYEKMKREQGALKRMLEKEWDKLNSEKHTTIAE
jgi:hypothetical protein